ncbi:MAG: nuclear transport factor 2 family protein [Solirubrobacterales bacterium]|nr:nuclear transport factor 2 family protein [Solirubrobacterales bacterium]
MSRKNLELVQRIYEERLLDNPSERLLMLAAPDIEYVNPPEAVDSGVRHGMEEVAHALQNMQTSFEATHNELHELFDAGDAVVASVSFRARNRGSESEVVQEEAHTWTLRDGRITRFEWGRDLGSALEAAGLSR